MPRKHKRWRRIVLHGIAGVLGLALPWSALAQVLPTVSIPSGSITAICGATGLCTGSGFGIFMVLNALDALVQIVRVVFIGVCAVYFAWFASMLIIRGNDENAVTEARKSFGYAAIGMGIVGIGSLIVQTFAPSFVGSDIVNPAPIGGAGGAAFRLADYLLIITGAFLVFGIAIAGIRIIALQGNEGEVEKQRKNFFGGLIGIVIVLLARTFVGSIVAGGMSAAPTLIAEVGGMVRFLLEIVAALAVISLVVAGAFYILSAGSDERKQRGQRILTSTIIILIIVMAAHTLVSAFIP